jgi:uncharacterized protein (TIGR03067 family)
MTTFILSIAVAAVSLATGDTPESELDKYQGTWVLVSEEFGGRKVPAAELAEDLKDLSYTIRGNRLLFTVRGEERSATIKLDPSKSPKTYDLVRDGDSRSLKGIYTWDGFKTIKVCTADDQGDRPEQFKTGPWSRNRIRVWRRRP